MIVDAHAHVWSSDPERYPWHPTFGYVPRTPATPQALLARMDALGIQVALLVQPSVYGDDHRFLLDTVAAHPRRFVPIGQVDPTEPASVGNGRDLVAGAGLVGLRVIFARDATRAAGQASAPAWGELATLGVPICLRVMPEHHQLAIGLLRAYPTVPFVIDHLGLPERPSSRAAAARLAELARSANCYLKLAGLARLKGEAEPPDPVWPLVRAALDAFGSSRLVWGSDFPGADERHALDTAVADLAALPFLSPADRHTIMGRTAVLLWGLPEPVSPAAGSAPGRAEAIVTEHG
jgi:predicted TIM-barrel fold metal-dependent hydrolase